MSLYVILWRSCTKGALLSDGMEAYLEIMTEAHDNARRSRMEDAEDDLLAVEQLQNAEGLDIEIDIGVVDPRSAIRWRLRWQELLVAPHISVNGVRRCP